MNVASPMRQAQQAQADYIRRVAAESGAASSTSTADEVAKLADLRKHRMLSDEEFQAQKAKALAPG